MRAIVWRAMKFNPMIESETIWWIISCDLSRRQTWIRTMRPTLPCCRSTMRAFRVFGHPNAAALT